MIVIVLLLDTKEKLYNYFANLDDNYWGEQVDLTSESRYSCHYFRDEEVMFSSNLIPEGYKEDKALFSKILSLSHK